MEINTNINPIEVSLKIPFPTQRQAEVAFDVLRVDAEPKRSAVKKTINLDLDKNLLIVTLAGEAAKNVRVSLTSFFDNLILCCETMEVFGPPSDKYDHY